MTNKKINFLYITKFLHPLPRYFTHCYYRMPISILMVFAALTLLMVRPLSRQPDVSFAAEAALNRQGLTVLVLNNAVDVHGETGSFYGVDHLLQEIGIPFETATWSTGFSQLDPSSYPLVIINDYVGLGETNVSKETILNNYVSNGGVVIAPQIIDAELQPLFGVSKYKADKLKFFVEFTDADDPSLLYLNRPEERTIRLGDPALFSQIFDWVGTYTASSDAVVLANALDKDRVSVGPTIVKRSQGAGRTYTFGFSFFGMIMRPETNRDAEAQRVYIDGFEPGADVLRLFVKAIYEEATNNHFVLKHIMPGPNESALIITHDVDAFEGYHDDPDPNGWGEAVARQFANLERDLDIPATYLFTTKYVSDQYSPEFWFTPPVEYICNVLGFDCHTHSVRHLNMTPLPVGPCDETFDSYDALNNPTLCGELKVPQELVNNITGEAVVSFRSPFLGFHRQLPETLEGLGYQCDSSFSAPDVLTNYPYVLMENTLFSTETKVIELPVVLADDALGQDNVDEILGKWKTTIDANAENNAINVLLIHPSKGLLCEADPNCHDAQFKLDAEREIVEYVKEKDLLITDMTSFCGFWRGRDNIQLEADYDIETDTYSVALTNPGPASVTNLTLVLGNSKCLNAQSNSSSITTIENKIIVGQIASGETIDLTAAVGSCVYLPIILNNGS